MEGESTVIEIAQFPRPTEKEELLLRLVDAEASTANELVERSHDRIGLGTVYKTLERMTEAGWLRREGRRYRTTNEGRSLIDALNEAERVYLNATQNPEGDPTCRQRP